MENMEDKIGSILGNPEMMQKIMAMAQSLSAQQSTPTEQPKDPPREPQKDAPKQSLLPDLDPALLQRFAGLARQSGVDKDQQTLLRALNPYLGRDRLRRLENAMRAAKMARLAAAALGTQGKNFR